MSADHQANLKKIIEKSPERPGVYFWRRADGEVLYVGRAVNLRNRLKQYLQKKLDPRIAEMVSLAATVDWLEADSLLEAIIWEAKYIKDYWPKYNIVDRDGRSFSYLVIPSGDYAKPLIARGRDLEKWPPKKAKVFGPYQSRRLLTTALRLIRPIFPWSTCQTLSGKPCFDYQIGLCPGACLGEISVADYRRNLDNLSLLLSGQKKRLLKKLSQESPEQERALKQLQDVALLERESDLRQSRPIRVEGYDISHFGGHETYAAMVVFEEGVAAKDEYRLFKIKEAPAGDDERALLETLERRFKHLEWPAPSLILIDGGRPQISFLTRHLKKLHQEIPVVGISKLNGDRLVFPFGSSPSFKEYAKELKPLLLQVRNEAHRFANYGRKRGFRL